MTYSIIPPILVILSLIGIILFLLKKAPQLSVLGRREREQKILLPQRVFEEDTNQKSEEKKRNFRHRFLLILEKVTRRFKVVFLKLENIFTSWNESIRRKRRQQQGEIKPQETENRKEEMPEKTRENKLFRKVSIDVQQKAPEEYQEKFYRPMVSE